MLKRRLIFDSWFLISTRKDLYAHVESTNVGIYIRKKKNVRNLSINSTSRWLRIGTCWDIIVDKGW